MTPTQDARQQIDARLNRAEEHIDTIVAELERDEAAIVVEPFMYPDRSFFVLRVLSVPEVPTRWQAIIGDAVHNLRSTLDHLAWRLALANVGAEALARSRAKTAFPLCESPRAWLDGETGRKLTGLSVPVQELIETFQPYQEVDVRGVGPWTAFDWLRELSNIDKHRLPPVVRAAADPFATRVEVIAANDVGGYQSSWWIGPTIDRGVEIVRIEIFEPGQNPSFELKYDFHINLHFADGNGPPVIPLLRKIRDCVADVVERLSPHLS